MSDVTNVKKCDTCGRLYVDNNGGDSTDFIAKITVEDVVYEDFCPECEGKLRTVVRNLINYRGDTIVYR